MQNNSSSRRRRSATIVNNIGILGFNTWRYYINRFGCCHFKGRGIEDNYYLLRPIYLNNGEKVSSRAKFLRACQENVLLEGVDFILSDHQAAVDTAKVLYHPELCDEEDFINFQARNQYYFQRNLSL